MFRAIELTYKLSPLGWKYWWNGGKFPNDQEEKKFWTNVVQTLEKEGPCSVKLLQWMVKILF